MQAEVLNHRLAADGSRIWLRLLKSFLKLPITRFSMNHKIARWRLVRAERPIDRPFSRDASLRLDRALMALEELEADND